MCQQNFPAFRFPVWPATWLSLGSQIEPSNPHGYFLLNIFLGKWRTRLVVPACRSWCKIQCDRSYHMKRKKKLPETDFKILKKQMLEKLSTPETPRTNGTCIVRWFRKVARWYYTAETRKRSRVQIRFSSLCVWKGQLEAVRCEIFAWNGESYISVRLAEQSSSKIEVGRDWVRLV